MTKMKHCVVHQVVPLMLKNVSFDAKLAASTNLTHNPFTIESVSGVFKSIPTFFFLSPRSIGRQKGFRHRSPLKQRNLTKEAYNVRNNIFVLGPAAYRDPQKVALGLDKALEFYYWLEKFMGLCHNEITCREMAIVLARGNNTKGLWDFLKEMSRRGGRQLVSTSTVTCLIKVLGEEGLVNEALTTFYRMKQFHCKPDVYAYNVVINALCLVGNFNKARFLLEQMELPGFRCPPDVYTYTILISSYCKYGRQTGCRKATRRRIWEANHLFRIMLFKGFVPDVVTYNCLIDGCCKTYRIERALELFDDMNKRGCPPNRVTYNSFIRYYSTVNEIDRAVEMMRRMQKMNHGVPSSSSYTPIIHALCEAGRLLDARNFLAELVDAGSVPREYTYRLVCDALNAAGESNLLDDELHEVIRDGIRNRCRQLMKVKPIMRCKMLS
ncbi:pentatricopeptide repeat-containing protein At1g77405 [Mangifera indica]|uniref:pentatricopeptide repeat-containing protein At1g77405 n=1 Tax=Mangifera indica TaxID=29780 RepID=UPI001CFADDCB|nr:pentatricopeptide repeat-containing protein At1g77405 [Mangifera indica]XP_044510577.1 pentatricopeptide repeat-containing protein At1g77405 [Mangifera indica]